MCLSVCLSVCLTKVPDQFYFPAVFGYAQRMVCHARAASNVTKDNNVRLHILSFDPLVLGRPIDFVKGPYWHEKKQGGERDEI